MTRMLMMRPCQFPVSVPVRFPMLALLAQLVRLLEGLTVR